MVLIAKGLTYEGNVSAFIAKIMALQNVMGLRNDLIQFCILQMKTKKYQRASDPSSEVTLRVSSTPGAGTQECHSHIQFIFPFGSCTLTSHLRSLVILLKVLPIPQHRDFFYS